MVNYEAGPGLLLVFAELGENVTEEQFHDWYDNEHIPLRTSSLETFTTAARYGALDGEKPKWAAQYSISDNTVFGKEEYTKLRANRSPREAKLVSNLAVLDRRIYKLSSPSTSEPSPTSPHPKLVLYHCITPKSSTSSSELDALMRSAESRFEALPGFLRVRRYDTVDYVRSGLKVTEEKSEKVDIGSIIEVSEFSDASVLESSEYKALEAWYSDSIEPMVDYRRFRTFALHKEYETTAAIKAMK